MRSIRPSIMKKNMVRCFHVIERHNKFNRPIIDILNEKYSFAKSINDLDVAHKETKAFDLIIAQMIKVADQGKHINIFKDIQSDDILKVLQNDESKNRLFECLRREKLIPSLYNYTKQLGINEYEHGINLSVEFKPRQ